MENSEVVEKQAVVGKLIDLSESEPASETIENVVTFLNESALPDILSIADDNVSEDSDHSVVIIDDSSVDSAYLLENNEEDDTTKLDVAESSFPAVEAKQLPETALIEGVNPEDEFSEAGSLLPSQTLEEDTTSVCDSAISKKQLSDVADLETRNRDCEEDLELKRRINFLDTIVENSFNHAKNGLDRNYDCLQKVFDELMQGRKKCLEEMTANAENLKSLLQSAITVKDKKKLSGLIDLLEACFSVGHWMDLSFKPKRLDDCKASMKDFVSSSYRGVNKVKTIFEEYLGSNPTLLQEIPSQPFGNSINIDPYLVTVTAVEHPGSFYIVRYCDLDERRRLFKSLKENAHSFPVPEEIVVGEQYAVCNSSGNWFRGVCGKICGGYSCGDLSGKLYQFFLPDQGDTELINSFSIRILPLALKNYPQMAKECSLNQNFNTSNNWSASATSAFKQMVKRSPMNMKVFGCESGVLNVDLAQLACFGEDSNIVSVRDALVLMGRGRPMTSKPLFVDEAPAKRVKPKFSESTQPSQFIGTVTSPYMPNNLYVQVIDEQLEQFHEMQHQLQSEFRDVTNISPSFVQNPRKGYTYAIKYSDNVWYRILLEDIYKDYSIFYIDTGHRDFVSHPEVHQLPDRFFQLPAQAVRCILAGISQPGFQRNAGRIGASRQPMKYPHEIHHYLNPLKGKEVMIFSVDWLVGGTGHVRHTNNREMANVCILYENERQCLNYVLAQTKLVKSERNHVYPEHSEKLLQWSRTRAVQEIHSSANMSSDSDDTLTNLVPESSVGACSLPPPRPTLKRTQVGSGRLLPKIFESFEAQADLEEQSIFNPSPSKRRVCFDTPSWIDLKNEEFAQPQSHACNQQVIDDFRFSTQSTVKLEPRSLTSSVELKVQGITYGAARKPDVSSSILSEVIARRGTQPLDHEVGIVATFVWCDSPESIYFRTSQLTKKYHELKELIKQQFRNNKPQTEPLNFEVGFPCAVFCDYDWYRAEVIDTDEYPECTVSLMDKGYQRKVQAVDIYPMTPELEKFPRTVLPVSLCGVYPPPGGVWDDKVAKYIGERLLGAVGSEPIKIFSRGGATSNRKRNKISAMICYNYMVQDSAMEIGGKTQFNLNEELINLGYCSNRPSLPLPLTPVRNVSTAWKPCEFPQKDDFWAKVTWVNVEGEIFLHDVRSAPKLWELGKWISKAYRNTQPSDADLNCKPGDLCIAKYEADGEWYRAIVQEVNSEPGRVTVIFVDYGTRDSVQLKNIRLDIQFEEIPILALPCTLHNIRVPGSGNQLGGTKVQWPIETLNILHKMVVEKEFHVIIKANGVPLQVHLSSRYDGVVSKKLVAKGLAEFVEIKKCNKKNKNKDRK